MCVCVDAVIKNRDQKTTGVNNGDKVLRCPAGHRHAGEPARSWHTLARWHHSERARAAHRGFLLHRTAHSNPQRYYALRSSCCATETGPANTKPNTTSTHRGWRLTCEHSDARTQRAARARCTHAPPAPRSQCILDMSTLASDSS